MTRSALEEHEKPGENLLIFFLPPRGGRQQPQPTTALRAVENVDCLSSASPTPASRPARKSMFAPFGGVGQGEAHLLQPGQMHITCHGYTARRASRDLAMDGESEKRWGGAYQDQEREGGRRGPPLIATLAQKVAHSGKWRRITVTSKCARIDSFGSRSSPRALPQRPGLAATDRRASSTVAFVRCGHSPPVRMRETTVGRPAKRPRH